MENQNVPIAMWNIHKNRHRTNNAVEGWNSKPKSITRKQQPDVFLQVRKIKEEAELVSWQQKRKETENLVQKEESLI